MPRALTSQKIPPLTDTRSLGQRAWLDEAACATMPVDQSDRAFFPSPNARLGDAIWDDARTICEGCPSRDACLADAMKAEEGAARYGFVGGKSPNERYALGGHATVNQRPLNGPRATYRTISSDELRQIIRAYHDGEGSVAIGHRFGRRPDVIVAALRRSGVEIRAQKTLKPCGTVAAYQRHLKNGERPCSACSATASAAKKAERQKARSAATKVCTACHVSKSIGDFEPRRAQCKDCRRFGGAQRQAEYRAKHGRPDRVDPAEREKHRARQAKARAAKGAAA